MEKKIAYYLGYELSPALQTQILDTIERIQQGGNTDKLCALAADTIINVTDAGFIAYYDTPTTMAGLSKPIKRATDAGIHTVQKGIKVVIRKLLKNRSQEDLNRLAFNLSHLVCINTTDPKKAYACFRLHKPLYQKAITNMRRVHEDPNVDAYRSDVIETIEDLIASGIEMFYTRPVDQANIGKLTRKAADLGMNGVQKGTNAVIHRMFKGISHQELVPLARYFETLLHNNVDTYYRARTEHTQRKLADQSA